MIETIEVVLRRSVDVEDLSVWQDVVVTAVPLHRNQLNQRGYNQSQLIADVLAEYLQVPTDYELIERHKTRQQQSRLGRQERKTNVKGVFKKATRDTSNQDIPKKVLLVDDVYTTGSTMNECAKVLKKELEVEQVYGFTLARG